MSRHKFSLFSAKMNSAAKIGRSTSLESITLMGRFLAGKFSPLHKSVGGLWLMKISPLIADTNNIDLRTEPS